MEIIIAQPHGYCGNEKFGVRGAIRIAQKTAKRFSGKTYLLGEIVHNQHVVDWLEKKHGVLTVHHLAEIPKGATVIIRAHGAPPEIYHQARRRGLKIIDATCPLVAQVHQEVRELAEQGKEILYLCSQSDHDEAIGVAGEAPAAVTLVSLQEIDQLHLKEPEKTVVLTQTTLSTLETKAALTKLKENYPELEIKPHICPATTQRQRAVIDLAKKVSLVVIVGSPTSSNSNRLREVAAATGTRAYIIDTVAELDPNWFIGIEKVAVSSGASTPEWLLEEVVARIEGL